MMLPVGVGHSDVKDGYQGPILIYNNIEGFPAMKIFNKFIKILFRLGLLSMLVIGSILGCQNQFIQQTPQTFNYALEPTITTTIQLTSVLTAPIQPSVIQTPIIPGNDVIKEILGQVNKDRALTDLRKISGEEQICNDNKCYTITTRQTGSEGLQRVKKYIFDELVKSGYSLEVNNWSRSGYSDQNLIAQKKGVTSPNDEIYFVAHIDGASKNNKERYPGADDDASGVADILELARVISNYSFNNTVVLFFSTGEEQGSLGVKSYLDQLSFSDLKRIKYIIDIDMIGYDANHDGVMELWHGGHTPSIALTQTMKKIILDYGLSLVPKIVDGCG